MLKTKLLSNVTVIFLSLVLLSNIALAQGFSDTVGTEYENKVDLVVALGMMEPASTDSFGVANFVTRAEFAVTVAKILNLSAIGASEQVFCDVTAVNPAFTSINLLFKAGIMSGSPDAFFNPDGNIKYEEAVKTLLVMNGYYQVAESKGGFPTGYIAVANEKSLLSGIKISMGTTLNRGQLAILIANALEMNKLMIKGIGENVEYTEQKGVNILSELYSIYKYTGILTGYGDTSLETVTASYVDGEVEIDGKTFLVGKTLPQQYLGMKVDYYYCYDEQNDTKTLIYISPKKSANNVVTVKDEDISDKTTIDKLVYQNEQEREISLTIYENPKVIYNGKLLTVFSHSDLKPDTGDVTLIDSNSDNTYETIIIKDYKTYVVDSVIINDQIVKTKYTKEQLDFNVDKVGRRILFLLDGSETELASISQWSVISVLESKNILGTKIVEVHISQEKITGTVTEITDGEDETQITLEDNSTYKLSKSFLERADMGYDGCSLPEIGKSYTFYLDIMGDIETKSADAGSKNNYGFLIGVDAGKGLEKSAKFKIFTMNKTVEILNSTSKVEVNGVSYSSEKSVNPLRVNPADATSAIVPQLITYGTNSSGLLNEYCIAVDKTGQDYQAKEGEFILNKKYTEAARIYKNMFVGEPYAVAKSTVVFDIPSDLSKEKEFKIGRTFLIDENVKPPFNTYNVSIGGVVGVIVTMGGAASTRYSTPQIVEKTTQISDQDGELKTKIVFSGGASILCVPQDIIYDVDLKWGYDNVRVTDLKEGDIIQYVLDNNKEINKMRVLLCSDNIGDIRTDTKVSTDKSVVIVENGNQVARVISVSEDKKYIVIDYKSGTAVKRETRQIAGGVRRFNSKTGRMESSSPADIQEGDLVFINTFWLSTTMIVIYR